jgi:hypothetical protein
MFEKEKKAAIKAGWEIKKIKSGCKIIPPEGNPIILHDNHSERHISKLTQKRIRLLLQKAGLNI